MVWILFFDVRDLLTQRERKAELQELVATKTFYENEIFKAKKELTDIQTSAAALEKIAREKYKMKMENEELFLVEQSKKTKK
jgi:cell division protein FtsB